MSEKIQKLNSEPFKANGNSVRLYLAIFFSCIGGFLFGYDTGIISGCMLLMKNEFKLTVFEQSSIVSVTIIGAWMFSLVSGYAADKFGRKKVILVSSIIFTIGSIVMGFANSSVLLIVGRFVLGIAIGLSSSTIPIYIAEITQHHQRGRLVTTYNALITGGQFFAGLTAGFFSTYVEGWRYMIILGAIPSALQIFYFFFGQESPRYLLKIGKEKEAYDGLKCLRRNESLTKIEFEQIKTHIQKDTQDEQQQSKSAGAFEVIKQIRVNVALRKAVLLGCTLQLIQQLAGINTIMYFSSTIIEQAGVNDQSKAIWLSSITGFVNFAFTFVGLIFVENFGRRKLVLYSIVGVCLSLLLLSGSFYVAKSSSPLVTDFKAKDVCSLVSNCNECVRLSDCGFCYVQEEGKFQSTCLPIDIENPNYSKVEWCSKDFNETILTRNQFTNKPIFVTNSCPSDYVYLIIISLVLYLAVFASGLGSQPWCICSEIYPINYRSGAFSLAVSCNWLSNTFVSSTFLPFIQLFTESGTFLIYFFFSLIGLVYFYFNLPETKNKKLEEIEKLFESNNCEEAKTIHLVNK